MPTIIFKATEACNSNCIYCPVVERKRPETISLELLELVFQRINEYLLENKSQTIEIIWHGGEPCIVGVDFFYKAIEYEENNCKETKSRIKHAIQSNLTLINQEFIDIFKIMGITHIGTSYEPYEGIRGFGKLRDSISYNKAFFKGVNILEENNFTWGFIYVVTKKVLQKPLDIFYFLSNLKLNGGFSLHPVLVYENNDVNNIAITPVEFANFLGSIFPVWWEHQERYPDVDPFMSILGFYTNSSEGHLTCNDSGACAYSHVYIGPSGNTSHCGQSSDWDVISYGNIKERSLIDIFSDEKRKQFDKRKEILPMRECKDCEYWEICNGGCPINAWNKHKSFLHKTEWCIANKIFLKNYFEPVTNLKPHFHIKNIKMNNE